MPDNDIFETRKTVRLLDSDGTIACLPFHLNVAFCEGIIGHHMVRKPTDSRLPAGRMVARDTNLTRMKRWTIAPVYRPSAAGGVSSNTLPACAVS